MAHPSRRAPRRTPGCYRTLTIVIFPVMIYLLQLFGKVSILATCASGTLVVCKAIVELRHHQAASSRQSRPLPSRSLLVPVHAPVASCYLCQQVRQLRPYEIAGWRAGICQHCHHWTLFSRQHA